MPSPGPLPQGEGENPARRPVQAKRRRANQAVMRPDALTPALSLKGEGENPARRPVQAKRRRANQAVMRPGALTPALSLKGEGEHPARRPVQAKRRRANQACSIDFSPRKRYVFAFIPAWTCQHYADYSVC